MSARLREFVRGEQHVYRNVAGEHLLVALHRTRTAPLFALSTTAVQLWQRLDAWTTEDALVEYLVQEFDVSQEAAAADVKEFLAQLESIGAVQTRVRGE